MSDFKINNLLPLQEEQLYEGVYLLILNARSVPPHLALTVAGKVYGISTKGPSFDKDVQVYLNHIKKRKTETVFVKLKLPALYTDDQMLDKVRAIVQAYPRVTKEISFLGAHLGTVKNEEKQELNIEDGVKIDHLSNGKFLREGIKPGFIITKVNNKKVASPEELINILKRSKGGVLIEGVYPNGTVAYYGFGM